MKYYSSLVYTCSETHGITGVIVEVFQAEGTAGPWRSTVRVSSSTFDNLCKLRSFGGTKEDKKPEETWFLHEVSIIPVKLLVPVLVIAKSVLVASVKSVLVTSFEFVNHTIFLWYRYSPRKRAKIGAYASTHSATTAAKHFSKEVGHVVKKSTVKSIWNSYKEASNKQTREKTRAYPFVRGIALIKNATLFKDNSS